MGSDLLIGIMLYLICNTFEISLRKLLKIETGSPLRIFHRWLWQCRRNRIVRFNLTILIWRKKKKKKQKLKKQCDTDYCLLPVLFGVIRQQCWIYMINGAKLVDPYNPELCSWGWLLLADWIVQPLGDYPPSYHLQRAKEGHRKVHNTWSVQN